MKRSKRFNTSRHHATTPGNAQLGDVRGGASMVEYAVVSNPSDPDITSKVGPKQKAW